MFVNTVWVIENDKGKRFQVVADSFKEACDKLGLNWLNAWCVKVYKRVD